MNVRELITKSWYLSGIVSRGQQVVTGEQTHDGLDLLNALLSFKTVDDRKIPYWTKYNFTGVIGQEKYDIPGLIEHETLTFDHQNVRYSMSPISRKAYFGQSRANNISSLPYNYHVERRLGGADLFMYFTPNLEYEFELYGKFSLSKVTLDQELSVVMDDFYVEYIRYLLARRMCEFQEITFPAASLETLKTYESKMIDVSPIDLRLQKLSILQTGTSPDRYGEINLARGWRA